MQTFSITDGAIDAETHVVEPHGEIDLATAPMLKDRLHQALDAGSRHLIIDLEDVDFIDSSGLAVLLTVERRVQPTDRMLIVVCPSATVRRVFEITGIDEVLCLQTSRKEALAIAGGYVPAPG